MSDCAPAGLPADVRQEDGTRDTYQLAFGSIDYNDSKTIESDPLAQTFISSIFLSLM